MNIQELKEQILSEMKNLGFSKTYSEIVISNFDKFYKFQQSNKSEEEPTQDIKKYIDDKLESYRQLNARYNTDFKAEILSIKDLNLKKVKDLSCEIKPVDEWKKEIEGMKKDIETLKKQVDETNKVYNEQYRITNSVSESVQELDDDFKTLQKTFNKIYNGAEKPVSEPKQERFYLNFDSSSDGYSWRVMFKKELYSAHSKEDVARNICQALNKQLEVKK